MMKIESKEKLAKLLATEDLDIQHQQVDTAYFDIVNRSLILPIWKDMPNYLLILAWMEPKKIMKKTKLYLNRGGKFILIYPILKIIKVQ